MVLLAPLVIPRRWRAIKLLLKAGRYFLRQVKRGFPANSADAQFRDFLQHKDPLQTRYVKASWVRALAQWQPHFSSAGISETPVLVVQGEQDGTVQWEYNLPAIQQHFSHYKEILLPEARHQLVNEAQVLREEVIAAVTEYLA